MSTEKNKKPPDENDDTGFVLKTNLLGVKVSESATDKLADGVKPHIKWLIFSVSISLVILAVFKGISMIWTLQS